MLKNVIFFALFATAFCRLNAQDAARIYRQMEKLNFLGSMLYVAAHPDDENTALISHFSNHIHAHTAYLSLTRGDGGQNLIGTELQELLGVIRTNELIQARKIDGGNQFFSSAIDFGYSKHPKETLKIWDKEQIQGEVIQRIRSFQPDIIIHRFDHRTAGSTHGHHTSSAILSHEAFSLANDPNSYPNQLNTLQPWQTKRQFFNTSWWFYGSRERFEKADKTNLLSLEIGTYDPLTGKTNSEIAAASRSSHKSQGFGSSPSLGARTEYIELINGERPKNNDPFDGINTSWTRLKGGEKVAQLVEKVLAEYNFQAPKKSLPLLVEIHEAIAALAPSVWKKRKLQEVKNLIKACAGLELQLNSTREYATAGEHITVKLNSVQHSLEDIRILSIGETTINKTLAHNTAFTKQLNYAVGQEMNSPYWLLEKGSLGVFNVANKSLVGQAETPPLQLAVEVAINGTALVFHETINYRVNDPVRGEVITPFYVLPQLGINFEKAVNLYPSNSPQNIRLEVTNYSPGFKGEIALYIPQGWKIDQTKKKIELSGAGASTFINYQLTPTDKAESGSIFPIIHQNGKIHDKSFSVKSINYEHIPKQYVAQPSVAKLVRLNLDLPQKKIGYIMGQEI